MTPTRIELCEVTLSADQRATLEQVVQLVAANPYMDYLDGLVLSLQSVCRPLLYADTPRLSPDNPPRCTSIDIFNQYHSLGRVLVATLYSSRVEPPLLNGEPHPERYADYDGDDEDDEPEPSRQRFPAKRQSRKRGV